MQTMHPIPLLENRYSITKDGQVWSHDFRGTGKGQWLKPIVGKRGYLLVAINQIKIPIHRLMAKTFFMEFSPDVIVDHIDRNKTNNHITNLRLTDKRGNSNNRPIQANNTSGFRGVSWDKGMKKWLAHITHQGQFIRLGYYTTAQDAAKARDQKALELHKEFAVTAVI